MQTGSHQIFRCINENEHHISMPLGDEIAVLLSIGTLHKHTSFMLLLHGSYPLTHDLKELISDGVGKWSPLANCTPHSGGHVLIEVVTWYTQLLGKGLSAIGLSYAGHSKKEEILREVS
jgi:hypothetical protein